uniref:Peptide hydrolase n=1 Tax=Psilocybe cubensis TaxID=181762 RepID=A0A8H8CL68_PSICU
MVLPTGLLLVAPFSPYLFNGNPCVSDNFYGNYRDGEVLYSVIALSASTSSSCLADYRWASHMTSAFYNERPEPGNQLVWLEKNAIDDKLQVNAAHDSAILENLLLSLEAPHTHEHQQHLSPIDHRRPPFKLHFRTTRAALVSLDAERAKSIDTMLPIYWKSTLLPTAPVDYVPVPRAAVEPVKQLLANLKFDPLVASVVNNISISQIKNDIRFLTGEDEKSGIVSRHSFSEGALTAAHWLKDRVAETGASCKLVPFLSGFAPNVICRYTAIKDTNATVLISGHYDSRGSFGSVRAPGGDDDGSGTTGVLSIARTIKRKGVKFHSNVELAFFAGEEQGLLGSRAYARELRAAGTNLTLMVQADMTAYRAPGEPLQLGLPDLIGTPEVTQLVANISAIYSPELQVGFTPACCSDHQSFHEQGFPATQVFERAGPIADPMYHNSGDLSNREGYDFEQLYAIAKVQFATILHTAGFEL